MRSLVLLLAIVILAPAVSAVSPRCEALEPAEQSTAEINAGESMEFIANCIDADGDWPSYPYAATWKIDQTIWSEDSPIDSTTTSWVTRMSASFAAGEHVVDLTIRDREHIEYGSRWFVRVKDVPQNPATTSTPTPSAGTHDSSGESQRTDPAPASSTPNSAPPIHAVEQPTESPSQAPTDPQNGQPATDGPSEGSVPETGSSETPSVSALLVILAVAILAFARRR